jgi:hypothetical protein
MSPATWASEAMRSSSSSVGWLDRWSEIAISPTPKIRSMWTMSPRTLPVSVTGGTWYPPVIA